MYISVHMYCTCIQYNKSCRLCRTVHTLINAVLIVVLSL